MLSPSSSISNLANANKKFKSDDSEKPMENKAMLNGDSAAVNLKASLNNNNNLKVEEDGNEGFVADDIHIPTNLIILNGFGITC